MSANFLFLLRFSRLPSSPSSLEDFKQVLRFEWDPEKNEINKRMHQVSFEEAQTVFYDEEAKVIDDPEHSADEERFIILGFSKRANLLVVCHCYRASETVIRIISARKATKTEMRQYFC